MNRRGRPRRIRFSTGSEMCCSGISIYGSTLGSSARAATGPWKRAGDTRSAAESIAAARCFRGTAAGRRAPGGLKVVPVSGEVLRDEIDFDHSAMGQRLRFEGDVFDRTAELGSAKLRNDAESALLVAAFGHLHIRGVGQERVDPGRGRVVDESRWGHTDESAFGREVFDRLASHVGDGGILAVAQDRVDFGHFVLERIRIPLGPDSRSQSASSQCRGCGGGPFRR